MRPCEDKELIAALQVWLGRFGFTIFPEDKLSNWVGRREKAMSELKYLLHYSGYYNLDEVEPLVKKLMGEYDRNPKRFKEKYEATLTLKTQTNYQLKRKPSKELV